MEQKELGISLIILVSVAIGSILGTYYFLEFLSTGVDEGTYDPGPDFTQFDFENANFSSIGSNTYWILEPGYKITLEGTQDDETLKVDIIVTNNEFNITFGPRIITTRVVIENETENGKLIETSYNFFAICNETGDVWYFGETVDDYLNGEIVSHEGEWLANETGNAPGVIMPGSPMLGAKYYQEYAPGVARDRAEIISLDSTLTTPNGTFQNCLITEETNADEPLVVENKFYAPGVGLIAEEFIVLTFHGFV